MKILIFFFFFFKEKKLFYDTAQNLESILVKLPTLI